MARGAAQKRTANATPSERAEPQAVTEIINSGDLIKKGQIVESPTHILKVKAALWIAGAAVIVGVIFLVAALCLKDVSLQSWATGLISLVVGTAIGFVFGGNTNNQTE